MRAWRPVAVAIALSVAENDALSQPISADLHPIREVKGTGKLPTGWSLRFDPWSPGSAHAPYSLSDVSVEERDQRLRVLSGPPAIYFRPSNAATGEFTYSATFHQSASVGHEAYGLFIGGSDLDSKNSRYLYVVLRFQNGAYLVRSRTGDARPITLVPWKRHKAVQEEHGRAGSATNTLALRVHKSSLVIVINGVVVDSIDRVLLQGAPTDGIVGLRVNHNIDVEVSHLSVTPRTARRVKLSS